MRVPWGVWLSFAGLLIVSGISCSSGKNDDANRKNLLRSPESVVYDTAGSRYLASNKENGAIIAIDAGNRMSEWKRDSQSVRGLVIVDGVLYAAADEGVLGWNLSSGKRVFAARHQQMNFLNDIAADNRGHLFVSDTAGNCVYTVNISDASVSLLASEGVDSPNGLYWDASGNRLLVASFSAHATIAAIDPNSGEVSLLLSTELDQLDGLALDQTGNLYCSSWKAGAVYKFDAGLKSPPILLVGNLDSPADFLLRPDGTLVIPEMEKNRVRVIPPTAQGR